MFHYQDKFSEGPDRVLALIVTVAIVGSIVLFIAGLFGGYYFDTIRAVPGNERSVPVPRTY